MDDFRFSDHPDPRDLDDVGAWRIQPVGKLCLGREGRHWLVWLEDVARSLPIPRPLIHGGDNVARGDFRWELSPEIALRRSGRRIFVTHCNVPIGWLDGGEGVVVYLRTLD